MIVPSCSSRTGAPLRYEMIWLRYSSAFMSWPLACSVNTWCGPMIDPVGTLTFQFRSAASTSLMPICRAASACGSSWACMAYFCPPNTCTWATPETCEIRCAMRVSANSSRLHGGSVVDVTTR